MGKVKLLRKEFWEKHTPFRWVLTRGGIMCAVWGEDKSRYQINGFFRINSVKSYLEKIPNRASFEYKSIKVKDIKNKIRLSDPDNNTYIYKDIK